LLTRILQFTISGLRMIRVPPASSMSARDIRSNADGLSYAIRATRWQKRLALPDWSSIYVKWDSKLPDPPQIDSTLYGEFDGQDRFELLTNNAESFAVRYRLFDSVRRSIDLATYYIQADQTGRETARRLMECARRGVRVRVLVDGIATARKAFENPQVSVIADDLRAAGVDFRVYHDSERPFDASHRKFLIVDGETLITGGRNYADHYSGTEWRDIDLLLTGPSVRQAQAMAELTLAQQPDESAAGVFQTTTPGAITSNASFLYLLECVRAAKQSLDIENAYYINHPILHRELCKARSRGVRIRILTNSAESNDLDFTNYRIYSGFAELLQAGIEVYLRNGKARTLHCKYFLADREWVGFGSSNLDFYSPRFCREAGIHVRSAGFAKLLAAWFEEGLRDASKIADRSTIEEVLQRQTIGRIFDSRFHDIQ